MISHKIMHEGNNRHGFGRCSMAIEVETFGQSVLEAAVEYLIGKVDVLWHEAKMDQDRIFPIFLLLPDGMRISEKLLWSHLAESSNRALELVVAYIERLHFLLSGWEYRCFYNGEKYFAGAHAIYSMIDYLEGQDKLHGKENIPLFDAFLRYLNLCDMEHESYEDDYISRVLTVLSKIDENRYFRLLHFRLVEGQYSLTALNFERLNGLVGYRGKLKKLVDYHLNVSEIKGGAWDVSDYIYLCSAVYGSNDQCIRDVLKYVGLDADGFKGRVRSGVWKCINRIREDCDQYRAFCVPREGFIDSGFHRYDMKQGIWLEK